MHNRLQLLLVHVSGRILHTGKVSLGKVDAADGVVVHRLEVDLAVSKVNGRRPLSGARHLRSLTLAMLNANRNVEVVENVETLLHGIKGSRLFWCSGTIEGSPHETRWRSGVAWYAPESRVAPYVVQSGTAQRDVGSIARKEIDIVVEVGHVPVKTWRIGYHTHSVFMYPHLAPNNLHHHLTS